MIESKGLKNIVWFLLTHSKINFSTAQGKYKRYFCPKSNVGTKQHFSDVKFYEVLFN